MSLARALAGSPMKLGHVAAPRREHDFYATADAEVTRALLASPAGYRLRAYGRVREPACGAGDMARVLIAGGLNVVSTDLIDRGYGEGGVDFLDDTDPRGCRALVTNPPFTLAGRKNGQAAFLRHADALGFEFVAMFAKSQFWHASSRLDLWAHWQPAAVYPLTWRPDFTGQGSPTMDCLWIVWDRAHAGATLYQPLAKPEAA